MTAPIFVAMLFLLNCLDISSPLKSDRTKHVITGVEIPLPIPKTALPIRISVTFVAKKGITPPRSVKNKPIKVAVLNFTFLPRRRPEIIVKGTLVSVLKVAMLAMASLEASGKFFPITAKAGLVALDTSVRNAIAQIDATALFFSFIVFISSPFIFNKFLFFALNLSTDR